MVLRHGGASTMQRVCKHCGQAHLCDKADGRMKYAAVYSLGVGESAVLSWLPTAEANQRRERIIMGYARRHGLQLRFDGGQGRCCYVRIA